MRRHAYSRRRDGTGGVDSGISFDFVKLRLPRGSPEYC